VRCILSLRAKPHLASERLLHYSNELLWCSLRFLNVMQQYQVSWLSYSNCDIPIEEGSISIKLLYYKAVDTQVRHAIICIYSSHPLRMILKKAPLFCSPVITPIRLFPFQPVVEQTGFIFGLRWLKQTAI